MLPKLERSAERMREGAENGRKGKRERSAVVKKRKKQETQKRGEDGADEDERRSSDLRG